ncbi:MAG: GNAT family N-acetyltransferase [Devosia sp.]|nr:GNAT family N-acetyltransferase [Devosia sp.]
MILVRAATPDDAEAMSRVLIASITALCAADHGNDPDALASWLANKTPEGVCAWFDNPRTGLFVAERGGEVAAVGGIDSDREIILNYVAPAHRFSGVSKALLRAMEAALGPGAASLSSTRTARQFYRDAGWAETGAIESGARTVSHPMHKLLQAAAD